MDRNAEIAAQFEEIAARLLLQGDSWFKVRAYQRAAQVMRATTEDIAVLSAAGQLERFAGIGEVIAEKTRDYLTTGRIPLLERLRAAVPDGWLALLDAGYTPAQVREIVRRTGAGSPEAVAALAPDQVAALSPRTRARVAGARA